MHTQRASSARCRWKEQGNKLLVQDFSLSKEFCYGAFRPVCPSQQLNGTQINLVLKYWDILTQKHSRITNTLQCAHEFDLRTVFFSRVLRLRPPPLPSTNYLLSIDMIFSLLIIALFCHRYRCCQICNGDMNFRNLRI